MIDGVTGILVPVGDAQALASALELVIRDRSLAAAFGSAGRERVLREFRRETVWEALAEEYRRQWRVTSGEQETQNGPPQKASATKALASKPALHGAANRD